MQQIDSIGGFVSLVAAARALGITYQQAHARVLSGQLPATRLDGRWFIRAATLGRLLEGQATAAAGGQDQP